MSHTHHTKKENNPYLPLIILIVQIRILSNSMVYGIIFTELGRISSPQLSLNNQVPLCHCSKRLSRGTFAFAIAPAASTEPDMAA